MDEKRTAVPVLSRRDALRVALASMLAPGLLATRTLLIDDVLIAQFSDEGVRTGAARVPKVVKTDAEWRKQLSTLAFDVARRGGTETPFTGAYWNLHDRGLFRCLCCDTALFSTRHKFDSGTGWPSFWDVIADENVITHKTRVPGHVESDLTCARCDAHLGDVFDDGPDPTGLRYCIDSVSLRFVKAK